MQGKVEICGVNTARLTLLTAQQMDELLRRAKSGATAAYNKHINIIINLFKINILRRNSAVCLKCCGKLVRNLLALVRANFKLGKFIIFIIGVVCL